jgi:hypothetical protein
VIAVLGVPPATVAEADPPDRIVVSPKGIRWSYDGGNLGTLILDDHGGELKTGRHPDMVTNVATG